MNRPPQAIRLYQGIPVSSQGLVPTILVALAVALAAACSSTSPGGGTGGAAATGGTTSPRAARIIGQSSSGTGVRVSGVNNRTCCIRRTVISICSGRKNSYTGIRLKQ